MLQLDVEVAHVFRVGTRHCRAVHQIPDRDQHAVEEHGVIRRQQQRALRLAHAEGVWCDTDRWRVLAMLHMDGAYRLRHSGEGDDHVAFAQRFDGDFAACREDARAGGEAGDDG